MPWVPVAGIALTILGALAACLGLLLRVTWQASAILSRLQIVETKSEEACRATGCIEQLEEGYSRLRDGFLRHDTMIAELRVDAGLSEERLSNGGAE
jgi:hypothetical protein